MNRTVIVAAAAACVLLAGGCKSSPTTAGGGGSSLSGTPVVAVRPILDKVPEEKTADARAKVHVDLGMAYFEIGKYDVALDEAQVALQENSSFSSAAYHLMGLVYMFLEDNNAAREYFLRALRAAPSDPDYNNSYGWFQCTTGQTEDGLKRLMLAARNPYYRFATRAYTNAGMCYMRVHDDANAAEQFRRAVDADPTNARALYLLAEIAYRKGDYKSARTYLVQLHQRSEPTAESVWLGVRVERKLGNRDNEASYAAQLRGRFAESTEFQEMVQGNYE